MQGVGSCITFCKRISNYIISIENKSPGCKIEMHFLKPEHSTQDFSITGMGVWGEPYGMNGINEYQRKNDLHRMFEI